MDNIKVNALMLRATDYLENDKILTLLSAERGKLTAGIKGVKKAGAKLRFAAQPFCFAEYILSERGGRYVVTQASECESFYELRNDINKFYAACAVCEIASAITYEGAGGGEIFSDCVKTLSDMCVGDEGFALVKFLFSALKKTGYGITLEKCPVCGESLIKADKMRFDMDTGSFCCWECGTGLGTSGVTVRTLSAAANSVLCTGEEGGVKKSLKLLREYLVYKTDAKCNSLSEYINLI